MKNTRVLAPVGETHVLTHSLTIANFSLVCCVKILLVYVLLDIISSHENMQ